jgi:hypothetical protein
VEYERDLSALCEDAEEYVVGIMYETKGNGRYIHIALQPGSLVLMRQHVICGAVYGQTFCSCQAPYNVMCNSHAKVDTRTQPNGFQEDRRGSGLGRQTLMEMRSSKLAPYGYAAASPSRTTSIAESDYSALGFHIRARYSEAHRRVKVSGDA